MNVSRSEKIASAVKNVFDIGKSIKKPSTLQYVNPVNSKTGLPPVVGGSFTVRIIMYILAGILLIGLFLLAIDHWVTPILIRSPGDGGYIPIPGTDISQVYWSDINKVLDITIGTVSDASGNLGTSVIEGQTNYSITMDLLIDNELSQDLGNDANGVPLQRTLFILGPTISTPSLRITLDNSVNDIHVTAIGTDGSLQSLTLENVPIHTPFRIGISKSASAMEGYLHGKLVMTRTLKVPTKVPTGGDKIFSTANIKTIVNGKEVVLSKGIKVINLRLFGYTVYPSEMSGRMGDLCAIDLFSQPKK